MIRFRGIRVEAERLRLGRDGERSVGHLLEALRANGAQVFHDLPGNGFNVDHAVISTRGIYAIETKTWSKPERGSPRVTFLGGSLCVGQLGPDEAPVKQAQASAHWVEQILRDGTGKRMPVQGFCFLAGSWKRCRATGGARATLGC
jgi:nuclease-like protein